MVKQMPVSSRVTRRLAQRSPNAGHLRPTLYILFLPWDTSFFSTAPLLVPRLENEQALAPQRPQFKSQPRPLQCDLGQQHPLRNFLPQRKCSSTALSNVRAASHMCPVATTLDSTASQK